MILSKKQHRCAYPLEMIFADGYMISVGMRGELQLAAIGGFSGRPQEEG